MRTNFKFQNKLINIFIWLSSS